MKSFHNLYNFLLTPNAIILPSTLRRSELWKTKTKRGRKKKSPVGACGLRHLGHDAP